MKNTILPLLALVATVLSLSANAGRVPSPDSPSDSTARIASPDELFAEILSVTGLQPNFELKAANVKNVEASISGKRRMILYNAEYLAEVNKFTGDKWAVMLLLSHEIGHHLNGHTMKRSGSRPDLELEADEYAGFVLQKLGSTLKQAQQVMYYISSVKESSTHPGRASRLKAIETGWNRAAASGK